MAIYFRTDCRGIEDLLEMDMILVERTQKPK